MDARPARAAFFDVDETLITVKSMFRFLEFHLAAAGEPPSAYPAAVAHLRGLARAGVAREHANREYYRHFAGRDVAEVAQHGRAWFARERRERELFHPPTLAEFHEHARAGDLTVLVSGSFTPCLEPIAELIGADLVLCSAPEIHDGRYTGALRVPMIGAGKASAARAVMAAHGLDAGDCVAYGDHASDLPLLLSVGCPVVVGDDPVLVEQADRHGWRRLPGLRDHQRQAG